MKFKLFLVLFFAGVQIVLGSELTLTIRADQERTYLSDKQYNGVKKLTIIFDCDRPQNTTMKLNNFFKKDRLFFDEIILTGLPCKKEYESKFLNICNILHFFGKILTDKGAVTQQPPQQKNLQSTVQVESTSLRVVKAAAQRDASVDHGSDSSEKPTQRPINRDHEEVEESIAATIETELTLPISEYDRFIVFNVGQGNCNLFVPLDPDGAIVFYDAGSSQRPLDKSLDPIQVNATGEIAEGKICKEIAEIMIKELKKKRCPKLKIVVSHSDEDHVNSVQEIINYIKKEIEDLDVEFYFGDTKETYETKKNSGKSPCQKAKDLVKFPVNGNAKFSDASLKELNIGKKYDSDFLYWASDIKNDNANSIVLRVCGKDTNHSVLMTGDAEKKTFQRIKPELFGKENTVAVSPHHGAEEAANDINSIRIMNSKNVVFSSAFRGGWKHPSAGTVCLYLKESPLQMAPLHLIEYFGTVDDDHDEIMREYGYPEEIIKKNFTFAFTKKGIYHTRTNGNVEFVFATPIQINFSEPSLPIFPSQLINLTSLDFENFGLTSDDIDYLSKTWLGLKNMQRVNLKRNAIDLHASQKHLQALLDERRKYLPSFELRLEPQYARPTDMHVKISDGQITFPDGEYDRGQYHCLYTGKKKKADLLQPIPFGAERLEKPSFEDLIHTMIQLEYPEKTEKVEQAVLDDIKTYIKNRMSPKKTVKLSPYGREQIVTGDGNCFFRSVAAAIGLDHTSDIHHMALRHMAAFYIKQNADKYKDKIVNKSIDEYFDLYQQNGTWNVDEDGIDIMIKAISDALQINIVIHKIDEKPIELSEDKYLHKINLSYDGNHYNAYVADDIFIFENVRNIEKLRNIIEFLSLSLFYTPTKEERSFVNIPINSLSNSFSYQFDLSKCGDCIKYFTISTGYKKSFEVGAEGKLEIWLAPRFLIDDASKTTEGQQFRDIISNWPKDVSVALFWTWSTWVDPKQFEYSLANQGDSLYELFCYRTQRSDVPDDIKKHLKINKSSHLFKFCLPNQRVSLQSMPIFR